MAEHEAYNVKLQNLQKFIPFLNNMMIELKAKGNREAQFNKIQSLHAMITDKKKKLKLETLNRCEEVLNNLYYKVNPQMRNNAGQPESTLATPRSPSPQRDAIILNNKPINIPTEQVKLTPRYTPPRESKPPKIDIYSSAAESLAKSKPKKEHISVRVPDTTKPPISLDDLKTLEDDVQDKINSVKLATASITQLNELKQQIALQLRVDEINKAMSPEKTKKKEEKKKDEKKKDEKRKHKSPEKSKSKDIKEKPPKDAHVVSDANDQFGNALASGSNKKKKKEEERLSFEIKEKKVVEKIDDKKKEETNSGIIDDVPKKLNMKLEIEEKPRVAVDNTQGPGVHDTVEIDLTTDTSSSDKAPLPNQAFKRLADKYNPKPKKTSVETIDVDKEVVDSIDKNMKISPVKVPNIVSKVPEPTPPPASLVRLTMDVNKIASDPKVELPAILQNMFSVKPGPLKETPAMSIQNRYPIQEANRTILSPTPPLLSPPVQSQFHPTPNRPPLLQTPISANYNVIPGPPRMNYDQQMHRPTFPNQHRFERPVQTRPNFDPSRQDMFRMNAPNQQYMHPQNNIRNQNFYVPFNHGAQQFNQYTNENVGYTDNNYAYDNRPPPLLQPEVGYYEQKPVFDRGWNDQQWGDYRGNRDPRSYREYRELKEKEGTRDPRLNRGPRPLRDPRAARDSHESFRRDSREMQEEPREVPVVRDPRIARERWNPKEDARDPRNVKERSWDPRAEARDTKLDKWNSKNEQKAGYNREDTNENDLETKQNTEDRIEREGDGWKGNKEKHRSKSVERRPPPLTKSRLESKFDKVYSKTGEGREGLSVRDEEAFVSPLDSLYAGKPSSRTGKGYGFQTFRIPKIRKPDPPPKPKPFAKAAEDHAETVEAGDSSGNESLPDFTTDVDIDAGSTSKEKPLTKLADSDEIRNDPKTKESKRNKTWKKIKNSIQDDESETEAAESNTQISKVEGVHNVITDDDEDVEEVVAPRRRSRRNKQTLKGGPKAHTRKNSIEDDVESEQFNESTTKTIKETDKTTKLSEKALEVPTTTKLTEKALEVPTTTKLSEKALEVHTQESIVEKREDYKAAANVDNTVSQTTEEKKLVNDSGSTVEPATSNSEEETRLRKEDVENIVAAPTEKADSSVSSTVVDEAQILPEEQKQAAGKSEEKQDEPVEKIEPKKSEHSEQNILAHFFENLLKSKNKQDKKTALFSLIETFSDSFSDRELHKISKIIKTNDESGKSSSDEDEVKKEEKADEAEGTSQDNKETFDVRVEESEEPAVEANTEPEPNKADVDVDSEKQSESKLPVKKKGADLQDSVVVSVGERIKSRRRNASSPGKPKLKHKTELDLLHEDIQEMFIRDGVLTATGKRMCRILKNDPNALSPVKSEAPPTEEPKKIRKKPGPKPKCKQNLGEISKMKTIKVVLSKMPENIMRKSPKRKLRSSLSKTPSIKETEDESDHESSDEEDKSENKADNSDQSSDENLSDAENKSQASDSLRDKPKERRKRKMSRWASGIISKIKKKKLNKSDDGKDATDKLSEPASPEQSNRNDQSEVDKIFVEPDKNYFLDPSRKAMSCKLCDFKGVSIAHHYKFSHPLSEVLSSRLDPQIAKETIAEAVQNAAKYNSMKNKVKGVYKYSYSCRLCSFTNTCFPLMFYEHVTTHTGEYRHSCGICGQTAASGKTLIRHHTSMHPGMEKKATRKLYNLPIIFGYMCSECNYIQLNENSVEEHVNIFHLGEKPKIFKINMSTTIDPALEDVNKLVDSTDASEEPPMPVLKKAEGRKKPGPKPKKAPELIADEDSKPVQEQKPTVKYRKKIKSSKSVEADSSDDEAGSPKKYVYKKPGPKSKTMVDGVGKVKAKTLTKTRKLSKSSLPSETSDDEIENKKLKVKRRLNSTSSEASHSKDDDFTYISQIDKRLLRENKLADVILEGRGRAAKEKASAKLKCLMEEVNNPAIKSPVKEKPSEASTPEKESLPSKNVSKPDAESDDSGNKDDDANSSADKSEVEDESINDDPPAEEIKKDNKENNDNEKKCKMEKDDPVKLNIFTCDTDVLQEDRTIEEERLKKMDELNKTIGSRTAKLDFVEKLSTRLNTVDEVPIKEEPKDDEINNLPIQPPVPATSELDPLPKTLPAKEPNAEQKQFTKKPLFEEELRLPTPTLNFPHNKRNTLINNMIEKLQGHLNNQSQAAEEANGEDNGSSETRTPLQKTIVGGLICLATYDDGIQFECSVNACKFKEKDQDVFKAHCQSAHTISCQSTLCEKCGESIEASHSKNFLESVFEHTLNKHTVVAEESSFAKPQGKVLRMRKLSGDKLSIKKEPEADEPSVATLELSVDNPFPFKIADVMSLAESNAADNSALRQLTQLSDPQPPPLMLISPRNPAAGQQLVLKESKMSPQDQGKPKKAEKAIKKFMQNVGNLYKCPHFYCSFTTNFKDFLERHMKAHQIDGSVMTACVYCDTKTPWDHVPMHIYIRHAHCRFACAYCLYRAVLREYVLLHQNAQHPNREYAVIGLPFHKQRKFAVADVKIDAKNLCKPYRCVELDIVFLFENEFVAHLKQVHGGAKVLCGQQGCTVRIAISEMVAHWVDEHGVGPVQCAYCPSGAVADLAAIGRHFAAHHPSVQPDYFVRTLPKVDPARYLGFTNEAFSKLPRQSKLLPIVNAPPSSQDKVIKDNPIPIETVPSAAVTAASPISVVTQMSPKKNLPPLRMVLPTPTKNIVVPTSTLKQLKIGKPTPITDFNIITTVSTITSGQTILLSPKLATTIAKQSALTKTVAVNKPIRLQSAKTTRDVAATANPPKPITISAEIMDLLKAVETVGTIPTGSIVSNGAPEQAENSNDSNHGVITPLEHIDLAADPTILCDSPMPADTDVDPLNIDTIITDPLASTTSMSEDESDSNISNTEAQDKSKSSKGLLGYQLYRCAVCCLSFGDVRGFKGHAMTSTGCKLPGGKPFKCVHCERLLRNAQRLVEHIRTHGVPRFSCSLCAGSFSSQLQVKGHMKFRHNIGQTTCVPVDPNKNNLETDEFVIRPVQMIPTEKPQVEKASAESLTLDELSFTPDQIDKIPIRQIFNQNIKCGLCHYTNKVRINIVRHLQMHLDEKQVSDSAPVNPVPCLEKNEKMFDKMTNLAASSFDGRMGGKKEKEDKYPEFVPTHCRFVCCASGCSYLCPEEANLRHHLMALHSDETSFTCAHCGVALSPPDADTLIKHFKLHGLHLYKCQYCRFLHHLKHKVERHVADNHLDMAIKVITIRYLENEQTLDPVTSGPPTPVATPAKNKPWRCYMCKYRCANENDIKSHVSSKHDLDSQFKCTLCNYKSDELTTFDGHFREKHPNSDLDIIYVYKKMEEEQKEDANEPFDTTPLWSRDKPRVRHIRGILFDESAPQANKVTKKLKMGGNVPKASSTPPPPSSSPSPIASTARSETPTHPLTVKAPLTPIQLAKDPETPGERVKSPISTVSTEASVEKSSEAPTETSLVRSTTPSEASIVQLPTSTHTTPASTVTYLATTALQLPIVESPTAQQSTSQRSATPVRQSTVTSTIDNSSTVSLATKHMMESIEAVVSGVMTPTTESKSLPSCSISKECLDLIKKAIPSADEIKEVKNSAVIVIDDDEEDDSPETKDKDNKDSLLAKNSDFKRKSAIESTAPAKIPKVQESEVIDLDDSPDYDLESEYSEKSLVAEFGSFGLPYNKQLRCPKCNSFKSKRIPDFIFHILKDFKVFRYQCRICKDESITYKYMKDHIKQHATLKEENIVPLPTNRKLETWIHMVIREQSLQILVNNTWIKLIQNKNADTDNSSLISCDYCHQTFKDLEIYEHMFIHWSEKPYNCGHCTFQSYSEEEVTLHMNNAHPAAPQIVRQKGPTIPEVMKKTDDTHKRNLDPLELPRKKLKTEPLPDVKPIKIEETNNSDSDDDLVIVSSTPDGDIVLGCEFCEFMSKEEEQVVTHFATSHPGTMLRHHKVNKDDESPSQQMSCNMCKYISSEYNVRQHFVEQHPGQHFIPYRFICVECSTRFLVLRSLKRHFSRQHPNKPISYKNVTGTTETRTQRHRKTGTGTRHVSGRVFKLYQCTLCNYKNISYQSNNLKHHMRSHCKPIECGVCHAHFKFYGDASNHTKREHPDESENIITNIRLMNEFNRIYHEALANVVVYNKDKEEVESTSKNKSTARKSTSAPFGRKVEEEFSYYGCEPEQVDLTTLRTHVEVNKVNMPMTVEQLSRMFDLNPTVNVVDCNSPDTGGTEIKSETGDNDVEEVPTVEMTYS